MGAGGLFPGVKFGWGVTLTTHLRLVQRSRISRNYIPIFFGAYTAVAGQLSFYYLLYKIL
jgi:hypothetical protein